MEDKIFDFMEKMYSDINKRFDGLETKIQHVENEVQHVSNQVTKLEHDSNMKFTALFDGYKQIFEKLEEHDNRFDKLEKKVDDLALKVSTHDVKLKVLEGGRKK